MTRAPRRRRRGWRLDELTVLVSFVRSAIRELTSCLLSSTAAPRVCSGRVSCPTYTPLYCTVPTLCEHAHHSEPPLCHCDAESKATPACDNQVELLPLDKRTACRRHQAQHRKASHERTATPDLHRGALKDWHEYNKEIKSKVIRCECPKNTGSTNAHSRAELSQFGRPPRR
jgi:hypothetical protein